MERFRACCTQLLHHKGILGPAMDGLSVCVSDSNGVTQDGSMVTLKWNYELK